MNNNYIDKAVISSCFKNIIKSIIFIVAIIFLYINIFKCTESLSFKNMQSTISNKINFNENLVRSNITNSINSKDKVASDILSFVNNIADLWVRYKLSYILIYALIPFVLVNKVITFVKYSWCLFNKRTHPIYRELRELGDLERLTEIVNREISGGIFSIKLRKNILTRNWIVIKNKNSHAFIPYNMIIWAYINNKWNIDNAKEDAIFEDTYFVKLYLLNGKKYVIKLNKEEANLMEKVLKEKLSGISFKFSVYKWVVWIKEKKCIRRKWRNFMKNNENTYFYLQESNNDYSSDNYNYDSYKYLSGFNAALKLRAEVLEIIESNLIVLDGYVLDGDDFPTKIDDNAMIPLIDIIKNMGADIISEKDNLIVARLWGELIKASVGSEIVNVRNKNYTLSSKICIEDDIIYAPLDFVTVILNCEVKCNKENLHVDIKEKDIYSKEQLNYAYALGAILSLANDEKINMLGGNPRNKENCLKIRKVLNEWWDIDNREDYFETLESLEEGMHNCLFIEIKEQIQNMSEDEFRDTLKQLPSYELVRNFETVKKYSNELGEKGIIGWDLSRAIFITGHAYLSGFINYKEAVEIIMEIAREVQAIFESWEEVGKNYLIGFEFWSGEQPESFTSDLSKRWEIFNGLRKDSNSPFNMLNWKMNLN